MSRQQGTQVVNSFVGGLVTEATALSFPDKACTETFNCIFDETGRITRRLGIDIEATGTPTGTAVSGDVFTEYRWDAVAGNGSTSFIVQQVGSTLYFFDISESAEIQVNDTGLTVDLNQFIPSGSSKTPADHICQFASGRGKLIVVNQAINPIYVTYDPVLVATTGTEITILIRDFEGVPDGLDDSERPTSTVDALKADNPEHYYNLLNQSWFIADALGQWDGDRTDLPSNRDYVALYRDSANDAFDAGQVTANTPGTRLATKGHFILATWDRDRTQAMVDEGFTGAIIGVTSDRISHGSGTIITDFDTTPAFAFDDDTTLSFARKAGAEGYIGKTFSSAFRVVRAEVTGSTSPAFGFAADGIGTPLVGNITLQLYGKQGTAPGSSTDGTLLGSSTFGNDTAEHTVASSDIDTFWDHLWIRLTSPGGGGDFIYIASLQLFTVAASSVEFVTTERPACTEFFAGRAWYAGISDNTLASDVYFSQIVSTPEEFGKCYQANDPASEDFTDLLADDGGVIVIPEIATITRLFAYQSALIIVATNGVWLVLGGSQTGFLATDFTIKKISDEGSLSPLSFLSFKGVPAWWGENGIFTIKFDANYQSFQVVSLTDQKIKTFINSIPTANRPFVKGAFHIEDTVGYWLYSDENTAGYTYNHILVVNGLSGAFYPWSIESPENVDIRGIVYSKPPNSQTPSIKFTATNSNSNSLFYAEQRQPAYLDFDAFSSAERWTAVGDAQIDTAQSKFGGASLLCDGTGDYVTTPDSPDWELGSGDWTIDFWFNNTKAGGTDNEAAGQRNAAGDTTNTSFISDRDAGNSMRILVGVGAALVGAVGTTDFTDVLNTGWHHYAAVRSGNTLRLFIDGVLEGSNPITGSVNNSAANLSVGARGDETSNRWTGWIDEFRLSVGVARWTSNFTPPVVPHVRDEFTKVLLHFDGTDASTSIRDSAVIGVDYDSFFVTGYKLEGQGMRFFQPNYITVFSEITEDASCFMQGIFDFTTSPNSGKWSTPQQVCNVLSNRSQSVTRRKVRGKGRALQLKFYSETGKPFNIIGWAVWITGNASV